MVRIDPEEKQVVIGKREELGCVHLTGEDTNWLVEKTRSGQVIQPGVTLRCEAQIRYNSRSAPAEVQVLENGLKVKFDHPQFGVAPGQAVVCYDGLQVLGGGWIRTTGSV